jgi:hypothetical protein
VIWRFVENASFDRHFDKVYPERLLTFTSLPLVHYQESAFWSHIVLIRIFEHPEVTFFTTMSSSSKGWGRGAARQDAHVDAIDLTLSSPEPEQRPRLSLQQPRLATHVKNEDKASRIQSRTPDSRARSINPQHLARIIETSSSQAVRDVLIDLCNLSPALRGAVARGLARHSTFAQGLIRQHQHTSRAPASRPPAVKNEEGQDARERMRQHLAARVNASGSNLDRMNSSSTSSGAKGIRPAGSQSVPRVKQERRINMTDSESDLDQYIPSDFPLRTQQATPNRRPLHPGSTQFVRAQAPPQAKTEARTCVQCQEVVTEKDEDGVCVYHEGPEVRVNGGKMCGGCGVPWAEKPRCAFGVHDVQTTTELNLPKRHHMKQSQSPSKKPRVL